MKVPVVENVLKLNDELADANRTRLKKAGIFTLDLIGAPGCGKTTLLEATLQRLDKSIRAGILVGDLTTTRDADRMAKWCEQVVQINTGKGCHLDANQIRKGMDQLDLDHLDLLVIENVGNMICPVGFDLGQDAKIGMFSIPDGDDKAAKHPYLVCESSVLILNKMDLLPHVKFDLDLFREDVKKLNPAARLFELTALDDTIQPWIDWLTQQTNLARV